MTEGHGWGQIKLPGSLFKLWTTLGQSGGQYNWFGIKITLLYRNQVCGAAHLDETPWQGTYTALDLPTQKLTCKYIKMMKFHFILCSWDHTGITIWGNVQYLTSVLNKMLSSIFWGYNLHVYSVLESDQDTDPIKHQVNRCRTKKKDHFLKDWELSLKEWDYH